MSGRKKCPNCGGRGSLLCPKCHGKGKIGQGNDRRDCDTCTGTFTKSGKITCHRCNGSGWDD